jgi:hypothetical protein
LRSTKTPAGKPAMRAEPLAAAAWLGGRVRRTQAVVATSSVMSRLVVEIHVPLVARQGVGSGDEQFPWIEQIQARLFAVEQSGVVEVHDDGEEVGDNYLFFITGAPIRVLLRVASGIAAMDGVPAGVFAVVTSSDSGGFGLGERVPLPLPVPARPGPTEAEQDDQSTIMREVLDHLIGPAEAEEDGKA